MKHGIIARFTDPRISYFGWPSVAVTESGKIAVASSGLRPCHIDPWGKTIFTTSADGGETFQPVRMVHNSPIDDRDAGLISLGGEKLLLTWFSSSPQNYKDYMQEHLSPELYQEALEIVNQYTREMVNAHIGSWTMRSYDGGETWDEPIRCPVNTPHGPIRLSDGRLFYFGKGFPNPEMPVEETIMAWESTDEGRTWHHLGTVPDADDLSSKYMHEPHAMYFEDGMVYGTIRMQYPDGESTAFTRSEDGGKTWSKPALLVKGGYPMHLCRHSSGALIAVYGWRHEPFGQQAIISYDRGETWSQKILLRDDGPCGDLGYPCTAELPDGSLLTVYYQIIPNLDKTPCLQYTHWTLDEVK